MGRPLPPTTPETGTAESVPRASTAVSVPLAVIVSLRGLIVCLPNPRVQEILGTTAVSVARAALSSALSRDTASQTEAARGPGQTVQVTLDLIVVSFKRAVPAPPDITVCFRRHSVAALGAHARDRAAPAEQAALCMADRPERVKQTASHAQASHQTVEWSAQVPVAHSKEAVPVPLDITVSTLLRSVAPPLRPVHQHRLVPRADPAVP